MLIRLRVAYHGPAGSYQRGATADFPEITANDMILKGQADRVRQKLTLTTARRPSPAAPVELQ